MFCSHCGTQIPDSSKFCFNCGASLSLDSFDNSNKAANNLGNNESKIIFLIQDAELSFDQRHEAYALRRKEFLKQVQPYIEEEGKRIQKKVDDLIAHAQKNKSSRVELDKSFLEYYDYGTKAVDLFVKTVHENLIKEKIYSYSIDMIKVSTEDAIGNFTHALADFSVKLTELMSATDSLEQARAMQRGRRSYWQGGGFGMVNAIKGSITAGLMNVATDSVRRIGDSIVDAGDDRHIFQAKYELLKSKPWTDILRDALIKDSYSIFHLYASFLADADILQLPPIDGKTSNIFFENAKYISTPGEKTKLLIQSILNNPYNADPYRSLLAEYNLSKDIIKMVDYFLDFYNIKWLSVTYCQAITDHVAWDKDNEDAFTAAKRAYQTIEDTIKIVESEKSSSEFYNFFNLYCLDSLRKGLTIIEESRRTSSDGIVHDTIEARDLYEEEYQQYKQYMVDNPESISIEEEKNLIEKAKVCNFKSEILIKKIQDRESGLTVRIKAQKALDTFEGRFAYAWPDKQVDACSKMSKSKRAQEAFSLLKHGKEATILHCTIIGEKSDVFEIDKKPSATLLIVSDYYIMIWCTNALYPYAIRTKDIKKLNFNKFFMEAGDIEVETYYSNIPDTRTTICANEKCTADLLHFIDAVNQTIRAVRSNISFHPEAQNMNQHCNEMNILSPTVIRQAFNTICGEPNNSWRKKGDKYVSAVINSACKGLVSPEEIILFIDISIFGNGKAGLTITDSGFFYSYMKTKGNPGKIDYKNIRAVNPVYNEKRPGTFSGFEICLYSGDDCIVSSSTISDVMFERIYKFLMYIRLILN